MAETNTITEPVIVDQGRGPQIAGTATTLFDIIEYSTRDWNYADVAERFDLSLQQVEEAVKYIRLHKEEFELGRPTPGKADQPLPGGEPVIIDRGRGPEIKGTRITVYDILDYTTGNWHHTAIAALFRVSSDQVLAAIDYIDRHRDEIMPKYERMLERARRGNPPEVQAKLDAIREKNRPMWEERKRKWHAENGDEGNRGGR